MTADFKSINAIDFNGRFRTEDDCRQYLFNLKWKNGYRCHSCGHNRDIKGKTSYHRRCQKCKYDESVLCHTMFQDMRMPVLKAFHLLFRTVTKKKGMSSIELSTEVGVQQKTAWLFKLKVKNAIIQHKLVDIGVVDQGTESRQTNEQKADRGAETQARTDHREDVVSEIQPGHQQYADPGRQNQADRERNPKADLEPRAGDENNAELGAETQPEKKANQRTETQHENVQKAEPGIEIQAVEERKAHRFAETQASKKYIEEGVTEPQGYREQKADDRQVSKEPLVEAAEHLPVKNTDVAPAGHTNADPVKINEKMKAIGREIRDRWAKARPKAGSASDGDVSNETKGNAARQDQPLSLSKTTGLPKYLISFHLWLRGTHHKCSLDYLSTYYDEFFYRLNYRENRSEVFEDIVGRFVRATPRTYPSLQKSGVLDT